MSSGDGRRYPLGIVGESQYQDAIRRCRVGEVVAIVHEPDNPHDAQALAVETAGGATIGYVPRTSWVRDVVFEQGQGILARIKSIDRAGGGSLGVVVDVEIVDEEVRERGYRPSRSPSAARQRRSAGGKGLLAGLLRGLFR